MKTFILSLIFIIFGFSTTLFAGDGFKLTLKVIDSYTHGAISNYEVQIKNELNELVLFKKVKNDTVVEIENVKTKNIYIKIITKNDKYKDEVAKEFILNKKKADITHSVFLYPTEKYEKEILHLEDSIYGPIPVREGPETNEEDTTKIEAKTEYEIHKFISDNIYFPEYLKGRVSDKIFVKFIVEPDGKVSHCTILKGRYDELKLEAIRIVRHTNWTPTHDRLGNKFRQEYTLPIQF